MSCHIQLNYINHINNSLYFQFKMICFLHLSWSYCHCFTPKTWMKIQKSNHFYLWHDNNNVVYYGLKLLTGTWFFFFCFFLIYSRQYYILNIYYILFCIQYDLCIVVYRLCAIYTCTVFIFSFKIPSGFCCMLAYMLRLIV